MAIPGIQQPTSAFTGPYTTSRAPILNGYTFAAGINMPIQSTFLSFKYPQFLLTSLLDRVGAYEGVPSDTYSWSVLDRTRLSATVSSGVAGLPAASLNLVTDIAMDTINLGYFLVNDVIRTQAGILLQVTATTPNGGFQQITVAKYDGSNIVTGDIANGEQIGHVFNAFPEGSTGPGSRLFLPYEEYNYTQILRRATKVSGGALTQKSWLNNGQSWYWTAEDVTFKEHARDIENLLMFGQRGTATNFRASRGLLDFVVGAGSFGAQGQIVNYASGTGIAESDLQSLIVALVRQGSSNDIILLCGSDAISDIQKALKSYAVNGAIDYGPVLGNNVAGLDFASYRFFGKRLHLAYYELFDDVKSTPFIGTPTATQINFRKFALALDMGDDSTGNTLVKMKYREHDGEQRKLIHKVIPGMHGTNDASGGIAANSFDGFEVQLLSEVGLEFRLPNRSGALISNS